MTTPAVSPDPNRLGGLGWTRRTGGALTRKERARLLGEIVRGQGAYVGTRIRLATGRVPEAARSLSIDDVTPPDSRLAREAEEAAREQTPGVIGHSYRSWVFGAALAGLDGQALDREQFYVASLLHDYGLMAAVAGEDFTIRSAARAAQCGQVCGTPAPVVDAIGDAITVHSLPGAQLERDGALGFYLQAGALVDLVGIRADELPKGLRQAATERYDRGGVTAEITRLIAAEAKANPAGRFHLLHRCGFSALIRVAPLTPR